MLRLLLECGAQIEVRNRPLFPHARGEDLLNKKAYDEGMAVRREVLGADYVDRAMASADQFTRVLYDFVTEWCWGAVWTRPGLTRKTRSLLNLGHAYGLEPAA